MASAGEGDRSRLRIGGWLPESEFDAANEAPENAEVRPQADAPGGADDDVWDDPGDSATTLPHEAARSGPAFVAADRWDIDPGVDLANEAYHGTRRADAPAARLWVVIAFVLVGLGAAVAIPVALRSSPDGAAVPVASLPSDAVDDGLPGPGGSSSPSPSATPSPSTTPQVKIAAPTFTSVTYEAEAGGNKRGGSARTRNIQGASGKKIVNRIGDWSDSEETEANNGTLTFNNVTVPADGTYTLTVYYTFLEDDPSRSATITVNGTASMNVSFGRPDGCCPSSKKVSITLKKGVNTILFSNSLSRAPAVDKIVIRRAA